MTQASDIVTELDRLYTASVTRLQQALTAYLTSGTTPDPASRSDGSFAYPEIRLTYRGAGARPGALVPGDRARAYRRRDRRWLADAQRSASIGAVRRVAHRLQPGAAAALHRHPARARPALRAVHQLPPLRRRIRPLGVRS